MSDTPENGNGKAPEGYLGDLKKTQVLEELFRIPRENRTEIWKDQFLSNVMEASFQCGSPQLVQGPDGFPYFHLFVPEPGKPFQCYVLNHMANDFLLDKGFGVVIGNDLKNPEWVFTNGDFVNLSVNSEFYSTPPKLDLEQKEQIDKEEQVLVGQPAENYLPIPTRNILATFLKAQGIANPRVFLMMRKKQETDLQELVFEIDRDQFESQEQYEAIMRSIGWFLPRHYVYVSMTGSNFEEHFQDL